MKWIIPGANRDDVVDENNSCYIQFYVHDPSDDTGETMVPASSVISSSLTIKEMDGTLIREDTDVNDRFHATSGLFRFLLTGADNEIVNDGDLAAHEDHIVTVTASFTAGGDTHTLVKNFRARVVDQDIVT